MAKVYEKAPRIGALGQRGERISLSMELIRGLPLATLLHRTDIRHTGLSLGLMHRDLHIRPSEGLPRAGGLYEPAIREFPGLSPRLRERMLTFLKSRRDDRLCHGAFHPGHVLQTSVNWRLIDWSCAYAGDPLSDIALTLAALRRGPRSGRLPALVRSHRGRRLVRWYLTGYFGKEPVPMEDIRRWQSLNRVLAFNRRRRGKFGFTARIEAFWLGLGFRRLFPV